MSLGKGHYVIKSLIGVGWVKLSNFRYSGNKLGYAYILTPIGIAEKAAITVRFLSLKQHEYVELQAEIEALRDDVAMIEKARHCVRGAWSNRLKKSYPGSRAWHAYTACN